MLGHSVLEIVLLIVVLGVMVFYILEMLSGRRKKEAQYDERQILARNKAYKVSFIFLVLYCTVCAVLAGVPIKWASVPIMFFIGVFGSVTVFVTLCIINDAYSESFPGCKYRQDRPYDGLFFTFGYGILSVFWFFRKGNHVLTNGVLNENFIFILFAVMFFVIFIAQVIKKLKERAAVDE